MVKQYTQKQYDSAKERAYKKGFKEGIDCISMDEALENSNDIKEWKKWDQFDFDWSVVVLIVVSLAVLIGMITYSPNL